jgi:MFS family permease
MTTQQPNAPGAGADRDRLSLRQVLTLTSLRERAMSAACQAGMVYPTLLAAIGDVAHPRWRASAVGVYRLWRDAGFAIGALLAGAVADLAGLGAAIWTVAALTAASGAVVAVRMYETQADVAPVGDVGAGLVAGF